MQEVVVAVPAERPEAYRPRIVDAQIERYLGLFGAVEVSGMKWCGKTWSSRAHANSVTYVDRGANLEIAKADPSFVLVGDPPHVIDEWQRVPAIWDTVRHAVDDAAGGKGMWLLTGSSTPRKDEVSHSGAGRIGRVRMHPMTLQESGESAGSVGLSGLFDGALKPAQAQTGIMEIASVACRGGWPEVVGLPVPDAQVIAREYLAALFEQSVPALGGDGEIARRLCMSLARNLGQAATHDTLARDVFARGGGASTDAEQRAVSEHLSILTRLFVVDEVPGWVPASRSPKRMRTKPKRYFGDPSVAVALLGLSPDSLLQDWQTFGLVFENLCMRDLDVYARALPDATPHPVRYYHDDSGLEIDAVVERADGRWGAIEVKVSEEKVDQAAANLLRLKEKFLGDELQRTKPPSFLAVLTATGETARQRPDGVFVVPIRCLGA